MMPTEISGFERKIFRHGGIEHYVFRKGKGPGVVITHELTGMSPSCIRLAERIAAKGFRVYLPLLFGRPGDRAPIRNLILICIGREFGLLARGGVSPVADWLRALCRYAHAECAGPGVGAIGLCFTGNLAIAVMADDSVMAAVTAEPARPLFALTAAAKADLGVPREDLARAKARAVQGQVLLGLRFAGDRLCPAQRFATLKREFGTAFQAIEIDSSPGNRHGVSPKAHSVLTEDFVDQKGHPTRDALERLLAFLRKRLDAAAPCPPEEEGTSGDGATMLQFKLEEFRALRSEISELMLENQTLERYAGGAVAAVVTWLLTTENMKPAAKSAAYVVPLLISALAALRCNGIATRLGQIGDYIKNIEDELKIRGWENYLRQPERLRDAPFESTARAYWIILIIITIVFFLGGVVFRLW